MNSKPHIPMSVGGILDALRHDRDAIPWPQRAEAAGALREHFQGGGATANAISLLHLLAADPKPEVRHTVALILPLLADADFDRLRQAFTNERNAYVRRTVDRAVQRRTQAAKTANKRRVGFDQVSHDLKTIANRHGEEAAQAAWRVSERHTELLVGSMVHDLRSILNHLRANAIALAAEVEKSNAQSRAGTRLKDDIGFLEKTIRDMEQFTTSLANDRAPASLLELIQAAREQAEECVRADGAVDPTKVTMQVDVPPWITVHVVPHLVVSALTNLIKNALESFAQPPADGSAPMIMMAAAAGNDVVELVIQDNGMGFAPEEAAALRPFTPGRRNKNKRNSTGYGLPNAMRNIAAHGGAVQIDSAENRGTTITVNLPLRPEKASDTEGIA